MKQVERQRLFEQFEWLLKWIPVNVWYSIPQWQRMLNVQLQDDGVCCSFRQVQSILDVAVASNRVERRCRPGEWFVIYDYRLPEDCAHEKA